MKKEFIIGLFCAVIVVQLAVPLSMITKRETTLKYGQEFNFKTRPVDPFDAFRGRYVALGIDVNSGPMAQGFHAQYGQTVYAQISVDEQGFARIVEVSTQKPKGVSYMIAKYSYSAGHQVYVNLPIDRYYMEENAAPRAERLYFEHNNRQGTMDTHVAVRIKNGFAVIEGLYIGGERIEDVLKKKAS